MGCSGEQAVKVVEHINRNVMTPDQLDSVHHTVVLDKAARDHVVRRET